jgi:hypothetical protein
VIGYYVHHHGRGHLERARSIAEHLREPVTGLSSLPCPPDWSGEWVELDYDIPWAAEDREHGAHRRRPEAATGPTAEGALHWAPLGHEGLRGRMAQIAAWIERADPSAVVCDVSVEVATFARLMGVAVVTVALPGVRDDASHVLGYRLSSAILAPWPAWLSQIEWPARWREKTHPVGAFSRFDRRDRLSRAGDGAAPLVTVVRGAGGDAITEDQLVAAQAATTGWRWRVLGPGRWVEDPWPLLCEAEVVVTHAGQNCISEIAAARRPAIVIPQSRPHEEQLIGARVLDREHLAIVSYRWPEADAWPRLLEAARALGGEQWARWSSGDGARRAAEVIEAVAARVPVTA